MNSIHFLASLLSLTLLTTACSKVATTLSEEKIVRGHAVAQTSPAYLSAVRLEMGGGLCTGTVIGPRLILTAAHCVADVPAEEIQVYFEHASAGLPMKDKVLRAAKKDTFKPFGAALFPNFDIAYIVLAADVPAPYAPIEILRDPSVLGSSTPILLAGYGKQADVCTSADCTGTLREALTGFVNYYDKAHIMSLLVFHGDKTLGLGSACNGDSGGPAYAQVGSKWYLIGVTNGTRGDITPQSDNSCDSGWDIYTYAGAYVSWLESANALSLKKDLTTNPDPAVAPLVVSGPQSKTKPNSWADWVTYANHSDPAYYTVDSILQNFVDTSGPLKAESTAILFDPALTEPLAATTDKLYLQGDNVGDLSPLKYFYGLKELVLDRTAVKDLSGLSACTGLTYLGIREFAKDAPDSIINSLGDARKTLEKLDFESVSAPIHNAIDWTAFQHLKEVSFVKAVGTLDLSKVKPRLLPNDSMLEIAASTVEGQLKLDGFFNSKIGLDNLRTVDGSFVGKVDWSSLSGLKGLSLDGFDAKAFPDFAKLVGLSELSLRDNGLTSIAALSLPTQLSMLDVSSNDLTSIDIKAPNLGLIKAYDNPFADSSCPALNCQTDIFTVPSSLEQLCANAAAAKKSEFEEPYFATLMAVLQQTTQTYAQELDCGLLSQYAPRARYLDLSSQNLSDIRPLAYLTSVRDLALDSNTIKDMSPLLGMTSLESLSIANNNLVSIPSLAGMSKLSTLYLMGNPITAFHVDAPELTKLYIGYDEVQANNQAFNLSIDAKSKLEVLYLGGLDLLAESLSTLHGLQTLRTLYYADETVVNNEDWIDSLNLNLIASHQSNFDVCGLINGTCVEQKSETESTTVLGPMLGTTAGTRTATVDAVVYLPGVASPVQTNNTASSF